jgi:hypothetical protein
MKLKIDEIMAFVSIDHEGNEGILSAQIGNVHMPLIGADIARIESIHKIALDIARNANITVKLVKFSNREDCKTIFKEEQECE